MATYRVTAPDGAVYNVTPPDGTNPTQDEILAQIQAQHGSGQPSAPPAAPKAPQADTRSAATRLYQDYIAKPVTSAVEVPLRGMTAPLVDAARVFSGESPAQVLRYSTSRLERGGVQGVRPDEKQNALPFAEAIVPQTPIQAGMMVGSLAVPPLAASRAMPAALSGLAKAHPALTRVFGGALGGEAGGQAEGATTGVGALEGAFGGVLGEILGAGYSAARRAGGKARIAAKDAADYGKVLGEASPPLKGASSVQELHELASGRGKELLGAAKEAANTEIHTGLSPTSREMVELPSLGETVDRIQPIKGYASATERVKAPKQYTLQEANDLLSEIGAKAFNENPLDRTFNGLDARRLYGQVRRDITNSLDRLDPTGYAAAAFDRAQQYYERGLAGLVPLQSRGAYRPGRTSEEAQFNTPYVHDYFRDPARLAELRDKFGDENVRALMDLLTRGGGPLSRDVLAPGRGGTTDALMQTYGRGQGGAPQYVGSLLRTLAPNFGSEYAGAIGRRPYDLPPLLRQIIDAVAQKKTDEVAGPR